MTDPTITLTIRDFVGLGVTIVVSGMPLVLIIGFRVGRWTHAIETLTGRVAELGASVKGLHENRERTAERLADVDKTLARVADRVGVTVH